MTWEWLNITVYYNQSNHKNQINQWFRQLNNTMITNKKYKHSDLTGAIIGCAMKVHSALGNGFQEVIYQRALQIEMQLEGLSFSREHEMPIYYRQAYWNTQGRFLGRERNIGRIESPHSIGRCAFGTGHQLSRSLWFGSGVAHQLWGAKLATTADSE